MRTARLASTISILLLGLGISGTDDGPMEFEARKTEAKHLDGKVIIDHFEGGAGLFYESTELPDGQPLQIRFTWDEITADSARWQQAFSFDGGKNWDTNWIMEITRQR
jgi:hypothetical protein